MSVRVAGTPSQHALYVKRVRDLLLTLVVKDKGKVGRRVDEEDQNGVQQDKPGHGEQRRLCSVGWARQCEQLCGTGCGARRTPAVPRPLTAEDKYAGEDGGVESADGAETRSAAREG